MFLNNNADSVPMVYLIFFDDMINVPEDGYDWGQAVLSCLYFILSRSCLKSSDCIAGPLSQVSSLGHDSRSGDQGNSLSLISSL
jgi:hypothetical protein